MPRCSRGHRPHSVCPDATESNLPVSIADDPLASVVLGTGRMLSDFRLLRKISID